MSRIVLYSHGGAGNHGCEAIVRGTCKILQADERKLVLYSLQRQEDERYGLQSLLQVEDHRRAYSRLSPQRMWASFMVRLKRPAYAERLPLKHLFETYGRGDIALSIGGDNYCYRGFEQYRILNDGFRKKGVRTVLWGCSVEPEMMDASMKADLAGYSLITARESISFEALKKINPRTRLYPDPAFVLEKKELPWPDGFDGRNVIGLNISPTVISYEENKGKTFDSAVALIEYILRSTDMQIALIPHVVWDGKDDRTVHKELYDIFKDTGRVVCVEDRNCMELKGYIARCRMFIGSRTHATIAAYSCCVPTVVIGYSVKAKGIAKDLFGTYENYVLPVQAIKDKEDMAYAFAWLLKNEDSIRNRLRTTMPAYCAKAMEAGKEIDLLRSNLS